MNLVRPCLLILLTPALMFAQDRLRIVVIEGESGVNIIQQKTAGAPVVEVRDRNNNPVTGATVTFAIKGGSSKAVIGNGLRQLAVTTDAAGRATAAINPVAKGAFEIQVNAAFGGQTASATIAQTNVATAAEAAKAAAGGGGHTGLIVTGAALAGGGVIGWQNLEKMKEEDAVINTGCGISAGTASVPAAGGNFTQTIQIDCNDWTATTNQPWVTLTGQTSGTSNSTPPTGTQLRPFTFTFTVQPNTGPTRTASIVIKGPGFESDTVLIIQAASGSE